LKKSFLILLVALAVSSLFQCGKDDTPKIPEAETVTDADGNVYQTIKMGNQTWMLENLKTTKFNDGTPINLWSFGQKWYYAPLPQANYQLASTEDLNKVYTEPLQDGYYGAVYNEFAIKSGKLAPKGWRIPTAQDFKELETYVASQGHAGQEATALKSSKGWNTSVGNGTDNFGFNGLPCGYVTAFGTSTGTEIICTWATFNEDTVNNTRTVINLTEQSTIQFIQNNVSLGAAIRCIKE
jgi:uncharacterized protein (TIGR02145 family)